MVSETPLFGTVTARSVGCARCSTTHQNTDAQVSALKAEGCAVVFQETISTRTTEKDRPQLQAALNALVEGDELVVVKLDRQPWQGSAERHQPPTRPPGTRDPYPHPGQPGEYEGAG